MTRRWNIRTSDGMDRLKGFLWGLLACVVLTLLFGCRSVRYVPVYIGNDDSTHTATSVRIDYVKDTLRHAIPEQKAERETRDTVSELENDYALSKAWITPDGLLHHTLRTKPQERLLEFDKPIERRDSIVYRTRTVRVPYPIEKDLGWWEKTRLYSFPVLVAMVAVLAFVIMWLVKKLRKK